MITEDYVSFETAKLLKEKGFNEQCYAYYNIFYDNDGKELKLWRKYPHRAQPNTDYLNVPTLQMAMKWLRDEKGIAIIPIIDSILDHEKFLWDIKIVVAKTNETFSQGWVYENPESGYDMAIRYCLENLI